jgi:hypothetical protein
VLSIGKCQNLGYYEREVIDGREDYLSEAGTAPGAWVGSLAAADGLSGPAPGWRPADGARHVGHRV